MNNTKETEMHPIDDELLKELMEDQECGWATPMRLPIELKVLDQDFIDEVGVPTYATELSAAVDLRANLPRYEAIAIRPGATHTFGTGFALHIDSPFYAAEILPRSGLGTKHGIVLGNLVGLIDSDYQGEIKVCLWNRGVSDFVVARGDRIAQMKIAPIMQASFNVVEEFSHKSDRGEGGFGSTGVK